MRRRRRRRSEGGGFLNIYLVLLSVDEWRTVIDLLTQSLVYFENKMPEIQTERLGLRFTSE